MTLITRARDAILDGSAPFAIFTRSPLSHAQTRSARAANTVSRHRGFQLSRVYMRCIVLDQSSPQVAFLSLTMAHRYSRSLSMATDLVSERYVRFLLRAYEDPPRSMPELVLAHKGLRSRVHQDIKTSHKIARVTSFALLQVWPPLCESTDGLDKSMPKLASSRRLTLFDSLALSWHSALPCFLTQPSPVSAGL
jgi:hypothetical protein